MDDYAFRHATAYDPLVKRNFIRLVERVTGQPTLKKLYLQNQRNPRPHESFWQASVRSLALDVRHDPAAPERLPKSGPVVFVANHPYGVLDGIVVSWLVEKVRYDFVVFTHSAMMRAPGARDFVLPADFSGTDEARAINLATRAAARAQLCRDGALIAFPAGAASTAPDALGRRPAVDGRRHPFVAQLIQRSEATVVPIWFSGQNSRLFRIASHVSATLRLALIFHEVGTRIGAVLPVVIGAPVPFEALSRIESRQALAEDLRARTYALAPDGPSVAARRSAGMRQVVRREPFPLFLKTGASRERGYRLADSDRFEGC